MNDNCPLPSVTSACPDVPSVIAAGEAVANTATCPVASGNVTVLSAVGSTTVNFVSFASAVEPSKAIL